jgi:hypothetical protein
MLQLSSQSYQFHTVSICIWSYLRFRLLSVGLTVLLIVVIRFNFPRKKKKGFKFKFSVEIRNKVLSFSMVSV